MKRISLTLACVFALSVSCRHTQDSQALGHFEENADGIQGDKDLLPFKGKLRVPAEYETVSGVLVGGEYLNGLDAAIQKTGVVLWMLAGGEDGDDAERGEAKDQKTFGFTPRTPWTRDYGPITALDAKGKSIVLDYNYVAVDRERTMDDQTPDFFAQAAHLKRLSLPLYLDGGNFMTTSKGYCMFSTALYKRNTEMEAEAFADPSMAKSEKKLTKAQIDDYLKNYFGCQKIAVFPALPEEPTEHIDL